MIPIADLLKDHQLYHSNLQMDYFITVRNGATAYGCYKQALRELSKRQESIEKLELDIDEAALNIADLQSRWIWSNTGRKRREIQLERLWLSVDGLKKSLEDTRRERDRFWAQASDLKEQVGDLTPERRAVLDREMWVIKIKQIAAADLLTQGRISREVIDLICSLPVNDRCSLMAQLTDGDAQNLKEWFLNRPSLVNCENMLMDQS